MNNTSLAAQAVAAGPMTAAPPSFDGHGWLVVLNLGLFTAVTLIGSMLCYALAEAAWRNRHVDLPRHPVTMWRLTGFLFTLGYTIRSAGEAAVLWRWNPLDPAGTGWVLVLQRFVEPVEVTCFGLAAVLLVLSADKTVQQLRRRPLPLSMWAAMPTLRRPAILLAMSMAAALAVVTLR